VGDDIGNVVAWFELPFLNWNHSRSLVSILKQKIQPNPSIQKKLAGFDAMV
jgi:hypothetical protein